MSGIGPSELILLVVVGLLILGPERLPRVATQIGRWVGRARRTANQLRYQLEREITLADIEGKKKEKEQENEKQAQESAEPSNPSDTDLSDAEANTVGEGSDSGTDDIGTNLEAEAQGAASDESKTD